LKKHNNSGKKSEPTSKPPKSRGPVQRDTKEVMAELVEKLKEKLDPKEVAAPSAGEKHQSCELRPNLDRLTVGVDLGDQGSHYCILGLEEETLAEGQLRTTEEDLATFFQGLNAARVVVEVGTHSAWVQEVIRGCGHEVLLANPRLMDGSKRRNRKNDRIDAHKLARLGRVDSESLHPIQHRSREVRQDLVMLRARDAWWRRGPSSSTPPEVWSRAWARGCRSVPAGGSRKREKKQFPWKYATRCCPWCVWRHPER
jgi:hypothetical protein